MTICRECAAVIPPPPVRRPGRKRLFCSDRCGDAFYGRRSIAKRRLDKAEGRPLVRDSRLRTLKNRTVILEALRQGTQVLDACQEAGIASGSYYEWRHDDPQFLADSDAAHEVGSRICKKCGSTDRTRKGHCRPCKAARKKRARLANPEKERARQNRLRATKREHYRAKENAWHKANVEKIRARQRAWRAANPDKMLIHKERCRLREMEARAARVIEPKRTRFILSPERQRERSRAYYEANRERINASTKAWYRANRDKARELYRAWRKDNAERDRALRKAWIKAHPEQQRADRVRSKRRRRMRQLSHQFLVQMSALLQESE